MSNVTEPTDVIQILEEHPTPTIMVGRTTEDYGISWKTAIFVKEKRAIIQGFGGHLIINMKAGRYTANRVDIVNILVMINGDIYEAILNYYDYGQLKDFEDLSVQKEITVIFMDEDMNVVKKVVVENQIRYTIESFFSAILGKIPWTDDEFDKAKTKFFEEQTDLFELWQEYESNN